ncbi:MAG: DUF898 family protein [Bacteroidetes bacterium]|nr:DUF898 family protein [Bacteroidota bacterium]
MKNYFNFNLTGKKLLPLWILFLILFLVPYVFMIFTMRNIQPGNSPSALFFPLMILLCIVAFVFTFYAAKLMIENIAYKDKAIVFNGSFGKYIGTVLLGFFLSIITLGIYMAWFTRNIHRFFIDNSSYDSQNFKFQGKGGKLFVILLLTIFLPVIILSIVMVKFLIAGNTHLAPSFIVIQQLVMMVIMIPYMYFVYKWMVNVNYKEYNISWETNFWNSCGKIVIEIALTIITLGIYMPLAMLRLYKYFADRTIAVSNESKQRFGYDIDPLNDFLLLWGQMLLTIITLGIYYPWACCKIGKRILSKTYLQKN